MVKKELDIAYFISFCIEQYKVHISANGNEVMDLFLSLIHISEPTRP